MAIATVNITNACFLRVEVKISKIFWVRCWIAKGLLRLAARVAGCQIKIVEAAK